MSTLQHFPVGSLVTSTATFSPTSGNSPPTTVIVRVWQSGVATSHSWPGDPFITQVSSLVFSCEVDTTGNPGPAGVEWSGSNPLQAVNWAEWFTDPAPF